jgi:CRISPR system Cascade subunit CasB
MTNEGMSDSTAGTSPESSDGKRLPFYWERDHPRDVPEGAELAALRRGVGRDAGSVPAMWRYYTQLNPDGHLTPRLKAEHVALTLYAIPQQSINTLMHQAGTGLGTALRALRDSDRFSPAAVDRRFNAAATATSLHEAAYHLRGLVRQLRQLSQGLHYTELWRDLVAWQYPDGASRVRRRWGGQYFLGRSREHDDTTAAAS